MNASYEFVASREPFVVEKRVRWSDCDPAGVVFTGKFAEYMLLAANYLFDDMGGGRYFEWLKELGVDTPCKGLEMEFHGAVWPEDRFNMHCTVSAIRESSYDITVEAAQADGRRIFTGRFSPICISREVRKRAPIPPAMLEQLRRFQATS